jgi:TonB family protein
MAALRLALALCTLTLFPVGALAQSTPDPAAARTRGTRAIDCLERVQNDLRTHIGLLRDAVRQLAASDSAARNDAAQAVVSLEQRIADLGRALSACVPREAHLEPRTVVQEPTGNEASVRRENRLPAVDRNQQLTQNVLAVIGLRVDGTGTVPEANVRSGMRDIAPRLERCYERLVRRGALQTGQLVLAFTITTDGRIREVDVEGSTIDNRSFDNCVRSAGRRLRPGTIARGGNARYAYTLKFGRP